MNLIAFYGDSVVAGVGARRGSGCVTDLARIVCTQSHRTTMVRNFGVSGMTSPMLRDALTCEPEYMASAGIADMICVYIGGDDLIGDIPLLLSRTQAAMRTAIAHSARNYAAIVAILRQRSRGQVVVGDLYNPYPASSVANSAISAFNETVIYPAAQAYRAKVAPVYSAFNGKQAQLIDGYRSGILNQPGTGGIMYPIHPNDAGHRMIAEVFAHQLSPRG